MAQHRIPTMQTNSHPSAHMLPLQQQRQVQPPPVQPVPALQSPGLQPSQRPPPPMALVNGAAPHNTAAKSAAPIHPHSAVPNIAQSDPAPATRQPATPYGAQSTASADRPAALVAHSAALPVAQSTIPPSQPASNVPASGAPAPQMAPRGNLTTYLANSGLMQHIPLDVAATLRQPRRFSPASSCLFIVCCAA